MRGTLVWVQVVIFDLMLLHSASNVITNTPRHVLFSSESERLPSSPSALCPCMPRDQSRRMDALSVAVIIMRSHADRNALAAAYFDSAAAPHIPNSTTGPGSFKVPPAFREALPPGARSLVEWAHPASEHAASGTADGARL